MVDKSVFPKTGVTFMDGYNVRLHTYNDFGLIWNQPSDSEEMISSPEIKTHTKDDISGMDGILDLTENYGEIRYKTRTLTLRFTGLYRNVQEWEIARADIMDKLHGRKLQISLDTDADWYWEGRVKAVDTMSSKTIGDIVITAEVFPYKRNIYGSSLSLTLASGGSSESNFITGRMPVIPVITTDHAVTVTYDGIDYEIGIVTAEELDFEVTEGTHTVTVTGNGTDDTVVKFEWTEGRL